MRDPGGWGVAPAPDGRGAPEPPRPPGPHRRGRFWIAVVALLALNILLVIMFRPEGQQRVTVPFAPYFLSQVNAGEVQSITSKGDSIQGTFNHPVKYPPDDQSAEATTLFSTEVPSFWDSTSLTNLLQSKGVQINAESPTSDTSVIAELLLAFGPTCCWSGCSSCWPAAPRGRAAQGSSATSAGRRHDGSIRRRSPSRSTTSPESTRRRPSWRRWSTSSELPTSTSGSGAASRTECSSTGHRAPARHCSPAPSPVKRTPPTSRSPRRSSSKRSSASAPARVRDLFSKAKEAAPSIIFIDELDAIGRSRQGASALTGANDEREQTLDQILTEMDGFESAQAVIVLGATNRPEVLDPALLRPGRFDRRVAVQPPDRTGRRRILEVHTHHIPLADNVDLDTLGGVDAGHGRSRPRQPRQRGRSARRSSRSRQGLDGGLHRLPRQDPARRASRHPAAPVRSPTHRVPRVRPRLGGNADAPSGSGPTGDDHPPWHGARCHAVDAGRRPRVVHRRRARGTDQGGARRARRRRGGVRRRHDRVRSPTSRTSRRSPAAWSDNGE